MMERFLDRWFPREVKGDPFPNIIRWTLIKRPTWALLVHKLIGNDPPDILHDHSRRFTSIGIRGSYIEETATTTTTWTAPWVRSFPAMHAHRILVPEPPVWTVVITGKKSKPSGVVSAGRWYRFTEYRKRHPDPRRIA